MASLEHELAENQLARIAIYGAAKTKKTWWAAGTAAEAGFNVLLLDGEGGIGILKNISEEAKKRITVLDIQNRPNAAKMAIFMARFCKMKKFYWHEEKKMPSNTSGEGFITIDPTQLTPNDVVILDSYTALVWSLTLRFATENSIDLADAQKMEWDGYGWSGNLASWMIQQLRTLPCHFIMVAHSDIYEKVNKKDKHIIDFVRTQMKSTSRPHSMQLADKFDDIYYFYVKGSAFKIDTASSSDRDGGSRLVAPKTYDWKQLPFAEVCKQAGIALPHNAPPLTMESSMETATTKSDNVAADSAKANPPVDATKKSTLSFGKGKLKLGGSK